MGTKQMRTNAVDSKMATKFNTSLGAYWIALLRIITGWWLLHAGLGKLLTDGLSYSYGPIFMKGLEGTSVGPLAVWMGENLAFLIEPGVPILQILIGLGLIFGVLTRLAAVGGVFFMTFFWIGGDFGHGIVTGELLGLLLFTALIVFAAGRHYGLAPYIESTDFVENNPRLRYLLG